MKSERVIAAVIKKSAYYFLEFIQSLGARPKTHPFAHNMKKSDIPQKKEIKKMQYREVTDVVSVFDC